MKTPDWTAFRSEGGVDPSGPCCLLENAFPLEELPRNYIWTLGYLGRWHGPEEAEISAQVKSYSRQWLIERAALLDKKRQEALAKEAEYKAAAELAHAQKVAASELAHKEFKDMDAIKQRIEAGPLQMAKSLVQTGAQLVTGGLTDPEKRMDICNSCPFKSDDGRCGKCGCVLAAKTRVKKASCPIGRW